MDKTNRPKGLLTDVFGVSVQALLHILFDCLTFDLHVITISSAIAMNSTNHHTTDRGRLAVDSNKLSDLGGS